MHCTVPCSADATLHFHGRLRGSSGAWRWLGQGGAGRVGGRKLGVAAQVRSTPRGQTAAHWCTKTIMPNHHAIPIPCYSFIPHYPLLITQYSLSPLPATQILVHAYCSMPA